jgi:hypothetical protein
MRIEPRLKRPQKPSEFQLGPEQKKLASQAEKMPARCFERRQIYRLRVRRLRDGPLPFRQQPFLFFRGHPPMRIRPHPALGIGAQPTLALVRDPSRLVLKDQAVSRCAARE